MSELYQYHFIRQDIPIAAQIIQMGHAIDRMSLLLSYYNECANTVLIGVPDESALLDVAHYLETLGYLNRQDFQLFFDTEWPIGYNALAPRPFEGDERRVFAKFKTYNAENNTGA